LLEPPQPAAASARTATAIGTRIGFSRTCARLTRARRPGAARAGRSVSL
jgi:hypothetical protein